MFKVQKNLLLSVQILIYLSENKCFLSASDIAAYLKISKKYAEQILLLLKKGDLVVSTRGLKGGYQLKKDCNAISMLEIVQATVGQVWADIPQSSSEYAFYWSDLQKTIQKHLSKKLSEIIVKDKENKTVLRYQI